MTKLIIMQGISGTGKTSLAYAFGKFTGSDAVIVPVQPSWKDRSDLLGYYNEFTGNFTETELLYRLYEAALNDDIVVVVMDEMNIARVEYYFAEFLSLLELPDPASRKIEVVSDKRPNDPKRFENGKLLIKHCGQGEWALMLALIKKKWQIDAYDEDCDKIDTARNCVVVPENLHYSTEEIEEINYDYVFDMKEIITKN